MPRNTEVMRRNNRSREKVFICIWIYRCRRRLRLHMWFHSDDATSHFVSNSIHCKIADLRNATAANVNHQMFQKSVHVSSVDRFLSSSSFFRSTGRGSTNCEARWALFRTISSFLFRWRLSCADASKSYSSRWAVRASNFDHFYRSAATVNVPHRH